jgi:hypothetical protein
MARTLKKEGILFKAVYVDYEKKPLPSRSSSGRFHDAESGQYTTYLTDSKDTAWKEVSFRWKADRKSYRMVEVRVKLKKVLDLTEPRMQDKYEVNQKCLLPMTIILPREWRHG